MKTNKQIISIIVALFLSISGFSKDDCFPEKPNRLVNDYVGLLSQSQVNQLESKLIAYNDTTSTQIAVVIVNDMCGYDKATYTIQLGEKWGVGQKGKNNGVVIMVNPKSRETFIATGYGNEGAVPDAIAKRIVENEMIPRFKGQLYYEGINAAIDAIIKASKGEYKAVPQKKKGKGPGVFGLLILGFIILAIISSIKKGNSNHHTMGGGKNSASSSIPFWLLMGSMMGSSHRSGGSDWGSFSSGSGSFGGFGGGSFGGGGAGGSW
jgi:uncharacterized protein